MQDEVNTSAAQLSAIKAEIATAKQSGRGLIEAATAQAAALAKDADAQAASLIKDAAAKAAVELQAERANREGRLKTVTKQLDDATNKFSAMQEATAKATKEAEAVERRAVAAQEALDKIQAAAKAIGGA
jgi:chaperonin cofactor prefoldin